MKTIFYKNGAISGELAEIIESNGIVMTCDDNMNIHISDEDWDKLSEVAPAAIDDFCELTYDVVFHSDDADNSKGFKSSFEDCMRYIKANNDTSNPYSYFADYKGGVVAIYCHETGEEVYQEVVR